MNLYQISAQQDRVDMVSLSLPELGSRGTATRQGLVDYPTGNDAIALADVVNTHRVTRLLGSLFGPIFRSIPVVDCLIVPAKLIP